MKTYAPPKLRQIVTEAVFRRKRIFLLTLYVVLGVVLVGTLLMHRKYQAEAKLMVQNVRSQAPLNTSPTDRMVQANEVSTTEINNEVDLLQSAGVARRALGDKTTGTDTTAQQDAIQELDRHLTVEAVHQSSLINVKLVGNSPEEASRQLRRLIEAYFQERAGAGRSSGAAEFFDTQVKGKGEQLDADQQALTDFEVKHEIADLDDQKKLQVQRVAAVEDQLATANASLARQQSMTAAQKRQLSLTPSRTKTTERTITNQYSQERIATSIVELENHRTELMKRYQPNDRQIVEVNEKLETLRRAAATAASNPAGEQATDANPVYQQLSSSIAVSSGEASGIAAQRAQLQIQLKEAQQRLTELEEATADYDALKRKIAQAQADYTVYAQKRDEARISEALDNAKMFDVALVQPPIASPDPVRPKPVLYLAAGLAFALLLGTLLALYADTSAEQVYTPGQLDAVTGTRTLATFADEDDADGHVDSNRLEYRRVLVAIRSALGAEAEGAGASAAPSLASEANGTLVGPTGHDEAVAQAQGKPAGYCVAFSSALAGEGVSYLLSNLATEAAKQASSRVAVLDMAALLRKFEAEENVSFAMKFDAAKQYWTLALNAEDVGTTTPLRQGGTQGQFSARLRPLLIEARKEFDYLFLDCPSFQESTLASELEVCMDGFVGVVSAGKPRKQNLEQMSAVLKQTRAPLLGYVLNRRRYPVPGWMHRLIW